MIVIGLGCKIDPDHGDSTSVTVPATASGVSISGKP